MKYKKAWNDLRINPKRSLLVVFALVLGILLYRYTWDFGFITFITLSAYVIFTVMVSNWRTHLRRAVNELDSAANVRAVDSLINFETVKYFNNEKHETRRYDVSMEKYSNASIQSQTSLSILNTGQAAIIAIGQGVVLVLAAMMPATCVP